MQNANSLVVRWPRVRQCTEMLWSTDKYDAAVFEGTAHVSDRESGAVQVLLDLSGDVPTHLQVWG